MTPISEVHTEGGEFRLDIVDDAAAVNQRRWRIVLKDEVLQVVLMNDIGMETRCISIKRDQT